MIDRLNPFSNHGYFEGKKLYLILTGQCTLEENKEVIDRIDNYFSGISEWMNFKFEFLNYFSTGDIQEVDDVKKVNRCYEKDIKTIIKKIGENE